MNYLVALLLLLIAMSPTIALAGVWSKGCSFSGGNLTGTLGTSNNTNKQIWGDEVGCYRFNNADGVHFSSTAAHMNGVVHITATSALVVFDPELDGQVISATTASIVVRLCPAGVPIDPNNPGGSCISTGGSLTNATLTGVEGGPGTQNAAVRVGPGSYTFEITGACRVNETCQISVRGEDSE